jgi:hypothetical protein
MTAHEQQDPIPSLRAWLGSAQPVRDGKSANAADHGSSSFEWGADLDDAIAALRASRPDVDAIFTVAAAGGLAVTPVRQPNGAYHPLMAIVENFYGIDWIIVGKRGSAGDNWGLAVDTDQAWAPSGYERHATPRWSIRIAHHT